MGFGFPAAVGAQVACPDKVVVDVAGDGSIQMNIQELATVVQYQLPVKVVILNNRYLGMVRQWQQLFYDRRYAATDLECAPDFAGVAKAYGAEISFTSPPSPGGCLTAFALALFETLKAGRHEWGSPGHAMALARVMQAASLVRRRHGLASGLGIVEVLAHEVVDLLAVECPIAIDEIDDVHFRLGQHLQRLI